MISKKRKASITNIYHIIARAVNKQILFYDDKDKERYLKFINEAKKIFNFDVCGYCLMTNHVHLVLHDKNQDISNIMKKINEKYALSFNKRYDREGVLFDGRFKSQPIESHKYLIDCMRYVHQNPVFANMVSSIYDYKFSSIHTYKNRKKNYLNLINDEFVLGEMSSQEFLKWNENIKDGRITKKKFIDFKNKITDEKVIDYILKKFKIDDVTKLSHIEIEKAKEIAQHLYLLDVNKKQISRVLGLEYHYLCKFLNEKN